MCVCIERDTHRETDGPVDVFDAPEYLVDEVLHVVFR